MEEKKDGKIKIGITIGDVNGIGIEVIIKTFLYERMLNFCTPVIYGSSKAISYHCKALDISDFNFNIAKSVDKIDSNAINVFNCWNEEIPIDIGKPTEVAGEYAYKALAYAVEDLSTGKIDGLVTAPVNKDMMQSSSFNFPGHTEYLTEQLKAEDSLMLMICETLRIGIVSGHIPLKDVSQYITKEKITSKLEILHYSLLKDFAIERPKIAVLGLNPHAGENGLIGDEEKEVINPAIEDAKSKDILVFSPYAADTFFSSDNYKHFDGVLAMYHDQGLIPFKTLCFENGVNYTAGLSHVRTSPDHGTAYDIAGKNQAMDSSFRQAVFEAINIIKNRINYHDMTKDPLIKSEISKEAEG